MNVERRFDRNERFFGREGQASIAGARIGVVGAGGLGSPFAQGAAYLGIRKFALVDADVVTESSLNRMVGSIPSDAERNTPKVRVLERVIQGIEPDAEVEAIEAWVDAEVSTVAVRNCDAIVGCVDDDLARLQLVGLAAEYGLPYIDLASEIGEDATWYGGRVIFGMPGVRCVYCMGELDPEELALASLSPEQREARDRSYGLRLSELGARGASVVSINGVVASLGLTELMVHLTGLRAPAISLTYRADFQRITRRVDEPTKPCPYCRRD
jgi:hypothetical protein